MDTKLNNKGMSLVELLIAITIASVVSMLIIVMMTEGTSMFRKESSNIDLQNEVQVVKNHLTDTFMEAKEIHLVKSGDEIRIYTGAVDTTTNALKAEGSGESYTDSILTYTDNKLYITGTYMETIPDGYLLSENILEFDIDIATTPLSEETLVLNEDGSHNVVTKNYYEGPISIKLTLTVGTEDKNKEMELPIKIRNDIDVYNIYEVGSLDSYLSGVTPTVLDIR